MNKKREQLHKSLEDKEYREAFLDENIKEGITFQIRSMRRQREWTQKQLGENAIFQFGRPNSNERDAPI